MIDVDDIKPIFDIVDGGYYVGFWYLSGRGQDFLAMGDQQLELLRPAAIRRGKSEGVAAINRIGNPLAKFFRIERGLGPVDGGATQARRLPRDRIAAEHYPNRNGRASTRSGGEF